jgi:hypothetical protein
MIGAHELLFLRRGCARSGRVQVLQCGEQGQDWRKRKGRYLIQRIEGMFGEFGSEKGRP